MIKLHKFFSGKKKKSMQQFINELNELQHELMINEKNKELILKIKENQLKLAKELIERKQNELQSKKK